MVGRGGIGLRVGKLFSEGNFKGGGGGGGKKKRGERKKKKTPKKKKKKNAMRLGQ